MHKNLWLIHGQPCFEADANRLGTNLNGRGFYSLRNLKEEILAVSVAAFRAQSYGWLAYIQAEAFLLTARLKEHRGSVLQCINHKFRG